jgi:Peptidase family S41
MHVTPRFLVSLLLFSAGCSSPAAEQVNAIAPPAGACVIGQTTCAGVDVVSCEGSGSPSKSASWGAKQACAEGQVCRADACGAYTEVDIAQLGALDAVIAESRDKGATAAPVDYVGLRRTLSEQLLLSDQTEVALTRTLWSALLAIPQGHQGLVATDGPDDTALATYTAIERNGLNLGSLTRYSACLRPYRDHAVVTLVQPGSSFKRGDEILAVNGLRGDALKTWLLAQPFGLEYLPPTDAGRTAFAWRGFFSIDRAGTVMTVNRGGTETAITLPVAKPIEAGVGCDDAFGRDYTKSAVASMRSDGTGVLYLPGFGQRKVADFEAEVGPEFDKVKAAPRLVIDIRGNGGGLLASALDLVSQLPDAKQTPYCEFFVRTADSLPPVYVSRSIQSVDLSKVPQPPRFPYRGKVAILVDGGTHSAADHFALAAKMATGAILIGTKTAGAYGTITLDKSKRITSNPLRTLNINRSQVRSMDGKPLDGVSVEPTIEVEYEPAALESGRDPMMERALSELSK